MIWISVLLSISTCVIYFIAQLNVFISTLLILIPLIGIFSIVWTFALLFKIRSLGLFIVPLILLSSIPILDIRFGIRYGLEEAFKSELLMEAIAEGQISADKLMLRESGNFELKSASFFIAENHSGKYVVNGDTIILIFHKNKPDFVNDFSSKWIIDRRTNKISYMTTGYTFHILKNELK